MEKIAVVTDTGSNLSFAQAKELGIYLLPLQITIDETTYQDTLEISTQDIYNELANGKMPKTSMAAYQKIYDLFEELKKDYDTIFATVYKGNIIKNLIMDCQSYTKYRPSETTGGIFVSWRRKEELPTGA